MYVFIARHGESLATLDPDYIGRRNPRTIPLTKWGYEQAIEQGESMADLYIKNERFQGRRIRIYSSLHDRINQSSEAIASVLAPSVVLRKFVDEELRQRDYGIFDGLCREAKKALDPVTYAKLHSNDLNERYEIKIPGGESCQELEMRLRKFLQRLKNEVCDNEDILIVNHGPQCRILEAILTHSDPVSTSQSDTFETGDIVMLETDLVMPCVAQILHGGKRRMDAQKDLYTEAV
jgi:broad specificity phosphatase PhoE